MSVIQAFSGALRGTVADQWKEIITAGHFGEYTVVSPGVYQQSNNGRGTNFNGSVDVISSGSKIFVPENTAAFIFSQGGIEDVITEPGGYEYQHGQSSVFNGDGFAKSIVQQTVNRFGYGGQTSDQKYIAFVNLREIRGIKFGTRGPVVYHDRFYGADLEILAYGMFSLQVVDPARFVRSFLPPNTRSLAFDDPKTRQQISAEFLQAFIVAVNSLSSTYRISELPSHAGAISQLISDDESTLGAWITRFGLDVVQVGIESIEFSPESRELVKRYSANKMTTKAYDDVSQETSSIAAQQRVASGVEHHGLGDGGAGLILGMNLAQTVSPQTAAPPSENAVFTLDEQIEALRKLKDLVDGGILSQEEFEAKKKQILQL